MREFFKGWRRNVGCVTLAMACVLASLWFRSLSRKDGIGICPSQTFDIILASNNGYFDCVFRSWAKPGIFAEYNAFHWFSVERQTGHISGVLPRIDRREFPHYRFADNSTVQVKSIEVYVPYPAPTTVLTLLSAFLILWRPRNLNSHSPDVKLNDATIA